MYSNYREKLLTSAQHPLFQVHSHKHSSCGPLGEPLFTDYIFSSKKDQVLLHFSGLHGIEGYLGSVIQQAILNSLISVAKLPVQVIIVHAINPYGMAWSRRVNAKNVDLNRNSLQIYDIPNDHFDRFVPFLNTQGGLDSLWEIPDLMLALYAVGLKKTVHSVASGQSDFPYSLFYSGAQLQPELESLRQILLELIQPGAQISILDVHTGLGRQGQEMLITDGAEPQKSEIFFRPIFKTPLINPEANSGSYRAVGTIPHLFNSTFNQNYHYICQEFGTQPFYKVLSALMKDNYLHALQFDLTADEKKIAWQRTSQLMQEAFFPSCSNWQSSCAETGVKRFHELFNYLLNQERPLHL